MPRYTSSYFASGSYLDMVSPLSSSYVNGVPVHVDIPLTSLTLPQKHPDRLVFCKRIELWKCLVPPSRKNLRCHQLHH